jgi:hypothetical protein
LILKILFIFRRAKIRYFYDTHFILAFFITCPIRLFVSSPANRIFATRNSLKMYSKEELIQLKKDFWEGFGIFCENLPQFKHKKRHWILYNTKIKGLEMKFDATREGAFVILEFNHPNEAERLEMIAMLEKYKNIFDSFFPNAVWEILYVKPCGTSVSRVYKQKKGMDIYRREQWAEFYPFLSKEMGRLEEAFTELKELFKEIS